MSKDLDKQHEQEVDLVPVFVWIGNGLKNVFYGLVAILKAILHFLILFLIFIKKNIILLVVMVILGYFLGRYVDQQAREYYSAEIRVKPYFSSSSQLLANIDRYQSFIEDENFEALSENLNISTDQAKLLLGISIEEDFTESELLLEYDRVTRSVDSVALESYTFLGYKDAKRPMDFEYFHIRIYGEDMGVVEKVMEECLKIKSNSGITAERDAEIKNVDFNIKSMEYQLTEIDSLISSVQTSISQPQIADSGVSTNLYLNDSQSSTSINQLFDQKSKILRDLAENRLLKQYYENTINVISSYVKKGSIEVTHYSRNLAIAFFGLGLLIGLIPIVWRFLNSYEKSLSNRK